MYRFNQKYQVTNIYLNKTKQSGFFLIELFNVSGKRRKHME